jgi:N-methylhydantoinase A
MKGVEGRMDHAGVEIRAFDEEGARVVARWFRATTSTP